MRVGACEIYINIIYSVGIEKEEKSVPKWKPKMAGF